MASDGVEIGLPLTAPQSGVWLDSLSRPGGAVYNICEVIDCEGSLDADAFRRAVTIAESECDCLGLRIRTSDGIATQVFGPACPDYAFIDVTAAADPEAAARNEAEAALERPLEPSQGRLSRQRLIRLESDRHWWVRVYHHVAMDGLGGFCLGDRTCRIYSALARGEVPTPTPFGRYRDFLAKDAAYPGSAEYDRDLAYWHDRLGLPSTRFPSETGASGGRGRLYAQSLASQRLRQLEKLAARLNSSLSSVLLAAFLLLLGRAAGTDTPVCAIPLLNRRGRAERSTVGLFSSVVPFPARLANAGSFADLVAQVTRQMRGDMRHMRMGVVHMRAAGLDPWRGKAAMPTAFNALDFSRELPLDGLRTSVTTLAHGPVDDVSLTFSRGETTRSGDATLLHWSYDSARHDEAGIARLADRFGALLAAIAEDPQQPLDELPVLGEREAAAIRAWECGAPAPLPQEPVHARVLAQAMRRPDKVAVIAGDRTTTYGELAAMTAGVTHRLAGIAPEEPVGLFLMPSAEQVAGFLGILAAGGAVLQLDPMQPPARLKSMIEGVGCRTVLTDPRAAVRLPNSGRGLRLLMLDRMDPVDAPAAPNAATTPEQLACIYHTSGSTGRPKPVGLTHGALAVKIPTITSLFGLNDGDECVCVAASNGFDPWLQQILLPLCSGGRLWMPERAQLIDAVAFWREVAAQGVTHLNLVPSMLDSLLPGAPAEGTPGVRRLVVGGERLTSELATRAALALRVGAIWNMYGPTETTIDATGWRVDPTAPAAEIPIGRVLPGYVVRILDDRLRRTPVGAVGELCIGGVGLARGYLGMESATAEKFIADPFGTAEERLYRTGDRATWRADGAILFRGRQDEQVKIRGQRIELGEVEAALRRQPGVLQAAVTYACRDGNGELTAHVVGRATPETLRGALAGELPSAAVPLAFKFHDALPLLPSDKVDRDALASAAASRTPAPTMPAAAPAHGRQVVLQRAVAAVWAELLGHDGLDPEANLFEIGGHSLLVPRAQVRLTELAGREVSAVEIFRFPTAASFAAHLAGAAPVPPVGAPAGQPDPAEAKAIAVVGMALRVPGADSAEALWRNLMAGAESVEEVEADALLASGQDERLLASPAFVQVHGRLSGIDLFDPAAFGYTPGDAAAIDPQQRLLLEVAQHALEDAGCDPRREGPAGVFAGVGFSSYAVDNLFDRLRGGGTERYATVLATDKDYAALRLAYKLGLTGPAISVSTACSTGLAALGLAVQALRTGQCRIALAGAASLGLNEAGGYVAVEGGIGSPSGRCRPFDAMADGTVGGSGAVVVVLKRLADALADGDDIRALIRGVGVANDGATKAAFTAPTVDGQTAAIATALVDSGVEPATIGFVEGHGTGTALGDPIEVAALNQAYGGAPPGSILLGSIKGNFGHLDSAAGLAGLVKAILALHHGTVPPTGNFNTPNPQIPFAEGPFRVSGAAEMWPQRTEGRPRRAAVSSFGLGGTNVHVVLEEAPAPRSMPRQPEVRSEVLALSAATTTALDRLSSALAARLSQADAPALGDVAHTLQMGRRRLNLRRAVIARTAAEAADALARHRTIDGERGGTTHGVVFLFPGQGSQYPGMGRTLYDEEPAFRTVVDEAAAILEDQGAREAADLLLADPADVGAASRLADTALAQPALFVVEYGIARLLASWGIVPEALAGHSIGELVAACVAGVMPFPEALSLVVERGRLMAAAPRGAMLAVSAPEEEVQSILAGLPAGDRPALAAVNGPRQCVAAGAQEAISALETAATATGRSVRRLNVSHAFHSPLVESAVAPFAAAAGRIALTPPAIPFCSNLGGGWIAPGEATDPAYWARHLRGTVRFFDNLRTLRSESGRILIEVGPGATLSRLARAAGYAEPESAATAPTAGHETTTVREAVTRLWVQGIEPDWGAMSPGSRRKVALPPYPFDRIRLWVDPPDGKAQAVSVPAPGGGDATVSPLPVVVETWRHVFGIDDIGPDADFFALGGDSMVALQIASRLGERLHRRVSTATVLTECSPARLASALSPEPADVERGSL